MLRFWVGEIGIDGLRIDAVPYLYEDSEFLDEPKSNKTEDPDSYDYLEHIYTFNLPEVYDMIKVAQCGNLRKFLPLRFYVNSNLAIFLEYETLPISTFFNLH